MSESPPQRESSIPQFLLDAEHPWIIKHQRTLESLPNVENFLFSTLDTRLTSTFAEVDALNHSPESNSESAIEDGATDLQVPADLLQHLVINNNRSHIYRAGWPNAFDHLQEMQRCPSVVLERVRSLRIEVWVYQGQYAHERLRAAEWQDGPGDDLLDLFASVLTRMTRLEMLRWAIPPEFASRFRDGFAARGLQLSSVKKLVLAPFCEYMVAACPNIEVLETAKGIKWEGKPGEGKYRTLLVEAAAAAPNLRSFSGMVEFSVSSMSGLLGSMPGLASLHLNGHIPKPQRDPETGERRPLKPLVALKETLDILAKLPSLERLGLPAPGNLGFGGRSEYKCSNPWPEAQGLGLGFSTIQRDLEDIEMVSWVAVERLPTLKYLSIEGREATITRDENGNARVIWPWTGRLEGYLEERYKRSASAKQAGN